MRLLIFGKTGMLGSQVYKRAKESDLVDYVYGTGRKDFEIKDYGDMSKIQKILNKHNPDIIINCLGMIKPKVKEDQKLAIKVNSIFPRIITNLCRNRDTKLIHMSTDCVYSGKNRGEPYNEAHTESPEDIYGLTKLTGDVMIEHDPNVIITRTSIIGKEFRDDKYGLVEWFLGEEESVYGYKRAFWSGFTTNHLSKILIRMGYDFREENIKPGLYILSSGIKNKFDILKMIKKHFSKDIEIKENDKFYCNRAMTSLKKDQLTQEVVDLLNTPLEKQIAEMKKEWEDE